jgi:hypothetical protein
MPESRGVGTKKHVSVLNGIVAWQPTERRAYDCGDALAAGPQESDVVAANGTNEFLRQVVSRREQGSTGPAVRGVSRIYCSQGDATRAAECGHRRGLIASYKEARLLSCNAPTVR